MSEFQELKKVISEDELDSVEVSEDPVEDSSEEIMEEPEVESESDSEDAGKFVSMLQQSISEEYEASALYISLMIVMSCNLL
jgi:hypothetical protein